MNKLFYTYTGKWSSNVLPTTQLSEYKDSIVLHERTRRLIHNGIIYGSGIEGDIYYVEGLSTNSVGVWTGTNDNIVNYYDGLTIIYVPKVNAGSTTTTLNINNLGAKTCYINNEPLILEHYSVNSPILLTYSNNGWRRADYSAHKDSYNTRVFNKDGQNYSYNIVFSEKSNTNSYTFAYVDAEFQYNPSTNTLIVGAINATLNSLVANGTESHISEVNRKVLTNIGITSNKQIAYQYANSIGASYFSKGTYYGEIFNDYDHNIAYGIFSSSFGTYNVTYNKSEVAFCSYNAYNQTQIFSIGIGTSNTNRKNALWVDTNGTTYTNYIIPQGNKTFNIGESSKKYNTIYAETFNGTSFTGTSEKVKVSANPNSNVKYIVGYRTDTKELYYENSLTFIDNGQLTVGVSQGTKPFVISSQTLVDNLNADLLDGKHASAFSLSGHNHSFVLGGTTIQMNGTYTSISGPFAINTSADSTKGFSIRRSGASEAVNYWVDDSTFHIDYTNDETSNQIAWRFINTDTESPHSPSQASDTTIYLNSLRQFYPNSNSTGSIGTSSSYWKDAYFTNAHITYTITNKISFNGTLDVGNDIKFIYWNNGIPIPSTGNVGGEKKPIYLKNGELTECTNGIDVNVKTGTQYRLAYYSKTNEISSGNNIWTNGTKLAINSTSEPTQTLFVNGTSMFKNTINIDSNTMGLANHINFNRAAFNCINVPTGGTFAVSINGASGANSKLAVDVNAVYPGQNTNIVDLGTSSYRWKTGYINNIITQKITFYINSTNINDIGNNSQFIYWKNGIATASTDNVGSATKPIYLKDGVITECTNGIDVIIREGTTNRLAYYSANKEISSANIISDGNYIKKIFTASDQTPFILMDGNNYDNYLWKIGCGTTSDQYYGFALKYIGTGNGVSNYLRLYADNQNGTDVIGLSINQSGQVGIGIDASTSYRLYINGNSAFKGHVYPEVTDTYDLGSTSLRWKNGYINNLITKKVTFYNGTNNINDIGNNTKFIYWLNGVATASTATVGNTGRPIYLNEGVFTPCNDAFIPKALVSKGTTATTTAGEVYGVVGNTTSDSRVPTKWYVYLDTGETELKDGMIIEFRLPTAGLGTVGECITIDGNEQHFHQVVYNTNSFLTTHFAINSVITVQYDATIAASMYGKYDSSTSKYVHNGNTQTSTTGVWRVLSLYDSGNTDVRYQQSIYYFNSRTVAADGAICRYTLCMLTKEGKITSLCLTDNGTGSTTKTMYSGYLDPRKIFYYASTTTYTANANIGIYGNAYLFTHFGDLLDYRYTFNCGTTLTPRSNLYLVGTINDNGFKLDSTQPWSCSLPTTEDGKVYIYIGWLYIDANGYRGTLEENNTIYIFKNGSIRIWSEYSEYSNSSNKLNTARTITIGATGRNFDGTTNISWTLANIFGTTGIGTTTNPIYYDGSKFVKTTYLLSATVNGGATNRMAYYSGANAISQASSIYATTTTLAINKTSAPANSGNFQVVGTSTMRHIYPEATDTYDLGSTSLRWKNGYINNLTTKKITFWDGTNNINDIGNNTKFIYWLNGVATASDVTLGSSSEPVYLNGGTFTKCTSYYNYGLTSFTKQIRVLKTWGDTGISGNNLETGTYIIQMIVGTNIYYSGVVSWYKDSTSSTETDEIVLHMAGKNPTERIYLKTAMTSSGTLKLQISGETDWSTTANIVFKFKKLI